MSKSARAANDDDDDDNAGMEGLAPRYGFSPKQIQEYKLAFREFDQNGKGELSLRNHFISPLL